MLAALKSLFRGTTKPEPAPDLFALLETLPQSSLARAGLPRNS